MQLFTDKSVGSVVDNYRTLVFFSGTELDDYTYVNIVLGEGEGLNKRSEIYERFKLQFEFYYKNNNYIFCTVYCIYILH